MIIRQAKADVTDEDNIRAPGPIGTRSRRETVAVTAPESAFLTLARAPSSSCHPSTIKRIATGIMDGLE
jgi:hypothetical protein